MQAAHPSEELRDQLHTRLVREDAGDDEQVRPHSRDDGPCLSGRGRLTDDVEAYVSIEHRGDRLTHRDGVRDEEDADRVAHAISVAPSKPTVIDNQPTSTDNRSKDNDMPVIRGAGLSRSAYSDLQDLVEPAETQAVTYRCPDGHAFTLRLFAEAETVPVTWDCPSCGKAARTDVPAAQEIPMPRRAGSASKTPWQQLLERRSIEELEVLLEERLALLRATDPVEAA
jgi:hypothetical protein